MNTKMQKIKQIALFSERNIKLFFKDKGTFFSAMISPLIVLVLYILFLHNLLADSFLSSMPEGFSIEDKLISGYVAAYEVSSILAVCCVTVAFVANMAMVDDRITGAKNDLTVSPVKGAVLALGYFISTAAVTVAVCGIGMLAGFVYIAIMGWYMTALDVLLIIADVIIASLFGTALSSVVCYFIKSNGMKSAIGVIVSSVYGFICGAYYPISQFSDGIANAVMCLPGTYCTGLFRSHFMLCFESAYRSANLPDAAISGIMESLDAKMFFFGSADPVPVWAMYIVALCSILLSVAIFVLQNAVKPKIKKTVKQ